MASPGGSRTPRRLGYETPRREDDEPPQNGTPRQRNRNQPTPSQRSVTGTPSRRTPRRGDPETPSRRSLHGRNDPSTNGTQTPRRERTTPNSDVVSTPMRWGGQRVEDGGASPASSVIPRSPGGMSEIDLSSPLNYGTPSSLGSVSNPRSGIRGTPIRMRPDVRTDKRMLQVNMGGEPLETIDEAQDSTDSTNYLVIWGTDVSISKCKTNFRQFILRYIDPEAEEDERSDDINLQEPLYIQKLEEIHTIEEPFLNVNCSHLETFDRELYKQLVRYPQEVIPAFDMIVNEMFYERYPAAVLDHQIQVRPYNAEKTRNMRMLNPEDIDQLITISGMVLRSSDIIPEMREAFFKCAVCSFTTSVEINRGHIAEPTLCTNCNTNHCFSLVHNRSQFTDRQIIKLQESPDDMPAGQTPYTVTLHAYNDLVDSVKSGDRVTVTGIYRAQSMQVNPRMRNLRAVYKTFIDVLHFRKVDSKRLYEQEEGKQHHFPPERVELIEILSRKPDIYDRLAHAIAPSIYENEDVKKGILLQLFGGTRKSFATSGRTNFRADINILLCGDPGTSKSQLLQYVHNLVPRSQYTSGKGSSAVGLTAYIAKDPDTRQLVLQTGALVLSDNGICCIDEFDKMDDSTRSVLHEVMEQQTLSIAKRGIISQLNARTSILAAANPSGSEWNKDKTIIENVFLPHTLLSRFDLIFLILDPQNEVFDKRLARHLVGLYYKTRGQDEDELLDMHIVRDYIAYAKEHIHPKLSENAQEKLITTYVDMRMVGSGRGQISAFPRQLESLIRLSEAHAKVRFSKTVEIEDVEEAYRLYREALKQSAIDPQSGKVDIGILTTGLSSSNRKRRAELVKALQELIKAKQGVTNINYQKLFAELKENSSLLITRDHYEDALKDLQDQGLISILGHSTVRVHTHTIT